MTATEREPWQRLGAGEICEACGHKGWCRHTSTTIECSRNPEGAYSTYTNRDGLPVYLHRRTGVPAALAYHAERRDERTDWAKTTSGAGCSYLYTLLATEFAKPAPPPHASAADARRYGDHAEAARGIADAFYLADAEALVRRIADEGRTQDAKNAGILYPDGHDRAGQLVNWLKYRKLYAWRDQQGYVRDLRGRALDKSTPKVLSLAGSREDRGAATTWYQQSQLAACDGHIRIAGGHEKTDALIVAGLPCVGSNEGQASDAMITTLLNAGIILATLHIDGEDAKDGRPLSEGQRLGLAIGDRLEVAGIAVRIAEPLRSPGEPKLDADTILRDHGPEALRDIDRRAVPLSLFRRRLGIAPPDHDPEQVKHLQEALREARDKSQRAQTMLTSVVQIRRNKHIKAERDALTASALLLSACKADGLVTPGGRIRQPLWKVADAVGKGSPTCSKHLQVGEDAGFYERQLLKEVVIRRVDEETGEAVTIVRLLDSATNAVVEECPAAAIFGVGGAPEETTGAYYIKPHYEPEQILDRLVTLNPRRIDKATGEEKDDWGGKRVPCPGCGSTKQRKVVSCADCGHEFSNTVTEAGEPTTDEAIDGLRAEQQPDEPRADAPSIPPTPLTPAPPQTYPQSATGPVKVAEPAEEEPDDWDPYECNERGCTRRSLPDKRYCDQHDPARLARFSQRHQAPPVAEPTFAPVDDDRDVAPVLPPYQPPPAPHRASVPLATRTGLGAACGVCDGTMYARVGKPLLCPRCLAAAREADLLGGDMAAGRGGV